MNRIQYLIDKGWGGQKRFAERYGIPLRTVQNWATGKRNPPEYICLMIEHINALKSCMKEKENTDRSEETT